MAKSGTSLADALASVGGTSSAYKFEKILDTLPADERTRVVEFILERDARGQWVRPHQAVAVVFADAGHDVNRNTIASYRSRMRRG